MMRIKITIEKYIVWFLVNFIICLLPIGISGLIANEFNQNMFLSYLAFNYTLIITGVYTYEKNKESFVTGNSIIFWAAILFCLISFALFIMFPGLLPEEINKLLENKIWEISGIILLAAIVISICLNWSSIKDEIENSIIEKTMRGTKRNSEADRKSFMKQLKQDQGNEN